MKKRFVSLWFPYLTIDWFALRQPKLRAVPFVLTALVHGRKVITAVSPLAKVQGICKGMVLADAKAIHSSLEAFDDKPKLARQLLQRIAEWCIRFTPVSAIDPPEGIILDASGCTHLWGCDEAYIADIKKRLAARGYTIRIAIADTVGAAWAVARFSKEGFVVEEGKHLAALITLPTAALRLDATVLERLHKLGLRQIADFINMPRPALRRRFGQSLLTKMDQASGEAEEIISPVYPVEPYQERLPCLEPIVTLTGIEIALQRLLESLCKRLRKEGKGLRAAYFRGYRLDGGAQGIEIETSRASQNETHLFQLCSLKLSTIEPAAGIELFVLEATSVEDTAPVQEGLWQTAGGLNDVRVAELIDRLGNRIGSQNIYRFLPAEHWWPERSVKRTASLTEQSTTAWRKDRPRPMQLLPIPERIDVTAPVPDYPPMNFRYRGKLHKVVKADGPERIEQEWWIQEEEHRDYYAVEDEEGCRYWLFRSGHYDAEKNNQWFLHGFFA